MTILCVRCRCVSHEADTSFACELDARDGNLSRSITSPRGTAHGSARRLQPAGFLTPSRLERRRRLLMVTRSLVVALAALVLASCGGSSRVQSEPAPAPGVNPDGSGECADSFDSTYDAIQTVIFERGGCTAEACHGSTKSGGLDL